MRWISLGLATLLACASAGCRTERIASDDPRFPRREFSSGFVDPKGHHARLEALEKYSPFGGKEPAWMQAAPQQ